jgi:hypothetical protein
MHEAVKASVEVRRPALICFAAAFHKQMYARAKPCNLTRAAAKHVPCQSLLKSAGQAPIYAHFFSNRHVVLSGTICVFPESFCSKYEGADAGQVQWGGGVSHGTLCSPSFTQCVLRKNLPVPTAGHFARKAPCRRAEGLSRWAMPEARYSSGGTPGQTLLEHRASQNT